MTIWYANPKSDSFKTSKLKILSEQSLKKCKWKIDLLHIPEMLATCPHELCI